MTPDEHATRAEELTSRARSSSMAGFMKRGRRREMLAAAQVHALLATRKQASSGIDPELLHAAEVDLEVAKGQRDDLEEALRRIEQALNTNGQDFSGGYDDIPARVAELMEHAYNSDVD
jgi:hypothetical protein